MEATTSSPSAAPSPQPRAREEGSSGEGSPVRFEAEPGRYRHWKLSLEGAIARVSMDVDEDAPMRPGYQLKLNSYDLAVDIELADIVQRLRFERPEVKAVVVTSAQPRIFCAGANIYMLGSSSHAFKVNFCKFTNETRLALEEACSESGQHYLAALNGVASGGGYELALACEEIFLCDDGSSAVSFPETPLLAVLPGTGGLTRLVDKRKVRRDLADVFSTLAEGVRGKRAQEWGLVDRSIPRSRFDQAVAQRAAELAAATPDRPGPGVELAPLEPRRAEDGDVSTCDYRHVSLKVDRAARTAEIRVLGPDGEGPSDAAGMRRAGADLWALRAFRELDDALLDLRFNHPTVGLVLLRTAGSPDAVRAADEALWAARDDWFVKEVLLHMRRVLKRLDLTARSVFALIEPGSCFAGSLFELALAADRSYMLDGGDDDASRASPATVALGPLNFGPLAMSNGLTRLASRFLGAPERVAALKERTGPLSAEEALEEGLCTFAPDAMDWDDEVRLAIEERVSLSPDALTGMEASLRFCGPETMETKIFSRLSAWQNWIFQRPNAVGQRGALTMYGRPERPEFDWRRT
ncbi:2,3-epoxybenzoyl-CoA dihydrolase [Sorangium cellulosum]|uniref:Crotonase n=1 Tax=Sorangium cellulosum So0157-2 TaxID=1254432 RepID=S4XRA8_SORCE|nr:2,3-epoxybenzoyl-CoA dihydrolase [Sorangium cellulosum]AGP34390.1 crotonase [Sorangium cellulosum So0157-2]